MYQRILCPLDFSEVSRRALEHALALANQFDAAVDALHVWEKPHLIGPDVIEGLGGIDQGALTREAARNARRALDRFLAPFAGETAPEATTKPVVQLVCRSGNAADTIVGVARELHSDLIVMGTHGRAGVSWWVSGSIAESVIRTAPCPVLTLRDYPLSVSP